MGFAPLMFLPGINGQLEVHEHFELPRISGNAPASPTH